MCIVCDAVQKFAVPVEELNRGGRNVAGGVGGAVSGGQWKDPKAGLGAGPSSQGDFLSDLGQPWSLSEPLVISLVKQGMVKISHCIS